MSGFVIRVICMADGSPGPYDGKMLSWYNPNLDADDSVAMGGFTNKVEEAMKFENAGEAMVCWNQERTIGSPRPDGLPNRPLTAFTVEIIPASEAGA